MCSGCSRRAGVTLIEVVAAIAILGTILVGVVMSKARHTRQVALTLRINQAVLVADELIAGWWASEAGPPIGASGIAGGEAVFVWETHLVKNEALAALGTRVLHVEIREAEGALGARAAEGAVVAVDLVLPAPVKPAANGKREAVRKQGAETISRQQVRP